MKIRQMKVKGVPIMNIDFSHEHDDEILLMKIREVQRRANVGGRVHEPGNKIMSDIPVDEEFSKLCCQVWN